MKTKTLLLFAATLIFTACNKNDSNDDTNTSESYINTNAGSTWNYHEENSSGATPVSSDYTVTSTSQDTTIESKSYHVYNYSYGGSQYLNVTGHQYYQYDSIPVSGGINVSRLYLKDDASAGTTWSQDFSLDIPNSPIPVPLHVDNKITEKDITRTINGTDYKNVTHVTTTLSSSLIDADSFSATLDSYYAPNYGLIENTSIVNLDFQGLTENINVTTTLMSADLK
jgi:hypothetical protein